MPVCWWTAWAKSESVKRFASSSCLAMRPVNATGWKLMPLVQSMYSSASRTMSPIWWSFSPLTMVGTKTIFRPALLHVLDALQLLFPQRLAARAAIDVVADAVELQVQGVQAGLLALLGELQVGELDAVGGHLGVREAHLLAPCAATSRKRG